MSEKDEYAFPFEVNFTQYTGMTLRDYFAAKAMQGLLTGLLSKGMDFTWGQVTVDAYNAADSMLKAREA